MHEKLPLSATDSQKYSFRLSVLAQDRTDTLLPILELRTIRSSDK